MLNLIIGITCLLSGILANIFAYKGILKYMLLFGALWFILLFIMHMLGMPGVIQ